MGAGAYAFSVVQLTAVGLSVGFSAYRIRGRLLPAWHGAPARLVEAVLAVAFLIWLCELLGLFGLLYASTLVIEAVLLAAAVATWTTAAPSEKALGREGSRHPGRDPMTVVALAVVFVVFALWGIAAKTALDRGIFIFDSLWYHMPFAAHIAQSHSVTGFLHTDTVYTNWFYPQNSELVHAAGILLTGRDTLSLFVNFAWLALALLAAWCAGRPFGRAPLATIAAAVVLASPTMVELEPGQAKNDVMAAALLLASLAILLNAYSARERCVPPGWALAAAGLAAGLAAGTRDTALPLVAALAIAAVALAPAGRRGAAGARWLLAALAGGGFWYVRNLMATGNPVPQVKSLGPLALPHPDQIQSGRPDFSVAHYLTDTAIWRDWFVPGLEFTFGELWWLAFGGAIAGGLIAAIRGRDRALRWAGVVALAGFLAYLLTPLGAGGPEGQPVAFGFNLRFVVPALLFGLVLLALVRVPHSSPARWALAAALLAALLFGDDSGRLLDDPHRTFGLLLAALVVLAPAALLLTRRPGDSALSVAAPFCALALLALAIGYGTQRQYLRDRYGPDSGVPGYGLGAAYAWAQDVGDSRIGLAGTVAGLQSYGFYGADLSNRVVYLGAQGPHGAFDPIPGCARFRAAVNDARLDYLVTAPDLDFIVRGRLLPTPQAGWLRGSSAVTPLLREGEGAVTVWRIRGRLDPAECS